MAYPFEPYSPYCGLTYNEKNQPVRAQGAPHVAISVELIWHRPGWVGPVVLSSARNKLTPRANGGVHIRRRAGPGGSQGVALVSQPSSQRR